jgi:hypothetical protein
MKTFKTLMEGMEAEHFPNESAITESTLREILDGVVFIAKGERQHSLGAALFCDLKYEDKIAYFNDIILPMYKKAKYPVPGKTPYLPFQDSIKAAWRSIKVVKGKDYHDYQTIKSTLGIGK